MKRLQLMHQKEIADAGNPMEAPMRCASIAGSSSSREAAVHSATRPSKAFRAAFFCIPTRPRFMPETSGPTHTRNQKRIRPSTTAGSTQKITSSSLRVDDSDDSPPTPFAYSRMESGSPRTLAYEHESLNRENKSCDQKIP